MFAWIVRRVHWLSRVPGFPQAFDAMLLMWTFVTNRPRFAAIEELEARVLQLPGVHLQPHRFGGIGFGIGGREIAHLHGNGLLDIHVTRQIADEWIAEGRALPHHVFGRSAWVSVWLRGAEDCGRLAGLIAEARGIPKNVLAE